MLFILDLRPSAKICAQYHIVKRNGHIGTVTELFHLLEKTSFCRFLANSSAFEAMKKSQSSRLSLDPATWIWRLGIDCFPGINLIYFSFWLLVIQSKQLECVSGSIRLAFFFLHLFSDSIFPLPTSVPIPYTKLISVCYKYIVSNILGQYYTIVTERIK